MGSSYINIAMLKKIAFILAVVVLGGVSGIITDRYFFPYLSTTKLFEKYKLLKKSKEDVTIIQKTEQVFMKEDASLNNAVAQAASAVVNISYSNSQLSAKPMPGKSQLLVRNLTGQIVTSDGIIITYDNNYRPDSGNTYKVMTYDGNAYDAEIWDFDSYSNILFLKISASNLPVISLGNSDQILPGERVITISNTQGEYQNGYSSGIISRYNTSFNLSGNNFSLSEKLEGVIESDFVQNENYVGGPLVDYAGEIIGITGMIEKDGQKKYFEIPSQKLRAIIDRGIKKELSNNPFLGVYYLPVSKSLALSQSLKTEKGALIYSASGQQGLAIIANSPAAKAGLKINDIVLKINNDEINSKSALSELLYKYKKGDRIELSVQRDGNEMKISVQL
jgi:S1-C subfamily serine protease